MGQATTITNGMSEYNHQLSDIFIQAFLTEKRAMGLFMQTRNLIFSGIFLQCGCHVLNQLVYSPMRKFCNRILIDMLHNWECLLYNCHDINACLASNSNSIAELNPLLNSFGLLCTKLIMLLLAIFTLFFLSSWNF